MPRLSCNALLLSLAGLACAGITGCGSGEKPGSEVSVQNNDSASLPSPSTRPPIELVRDGEPFSAAGRSTVPAPSETKARALFDALVSPGNPEADWDRTLEQLLAEGESATRVLGDKLARGTDPEREMAATTLALLGPAAIGAAQELEAALNDPLPFVQANAAATLIQLPDHSRQAIPALTRLLLADDPQLRQLAAVNLNAAGVVLTEQVAPLRQVLQQERSSEVLTPVVELLGRIGKPAEAALPELKKIAVEQPGDLGSAASSAIQLISGESESEPATSL